MKKRLQCFIVSCLMFILLSINVFAEGYISTVTFALDQTTSAPLYSFAVVRRSYGDLISAGATGYLTNDVIRSAILNAKTSVGSGGVFNSGNPWNQNLFGSQVFIPSVLGSDVYGMYKSSSMEEEYLFRNGSGTLRSSAGNNLKYGTHTGYTATQISEVESCFNEFATNWAATDTSGKRKYDAVSFETFYHGDTHITTVETIAYHYVLHLSGYDDFGISWNSELGSTGYTYAQFGEAATFIAWDYHRPGMNAYAGFCQSLNSDKSDWYYAIETYYYNGIYKATLTPSMPGTIYAMTPATALSGINDRAGFNEPSDWAIMKGSGKYLDAGATLNDYVTTFRNHTLNATDNKSVPIVSSTGTYTKRDFYYDMIIGGLGNNFCDRDKFVGRNGNPLISNLGTNDGVGTGCTLWIDCNNGKLPGQALDVPSDIPNFNVDENQAWGIKFEPSPQHGQIYSDNKQPIGGYLKIVDMSTSFGLNSYINRIANSSYGYFVLDVTISDPTADSTNLSPTCTYGLNETDTGTDNTTKHIRKVFDMSSVEDRATAQYYLMGGKMFYLYGNNDGIPNVNNGSMLAIDADVTFGFSVNANPADLTEFKDYWTTGTEPARGAAKWYSSNPAGNDWLDDPVRNARIGGGKNVNPNTPSWLLEPATFGDDSDYAFHITSGPQVDCYAAIKDSNGWDQDWDTLAGIPTTATVSAVFGAPLAVYDVYGNFVSQKLERYVLVSTVVQDVEALYTLELEIPYISNSCVNSIGQAAPGRWVVLQDDPLFKDPANWPEQVKYTEESQDGEFGPTSSFSYYQSDQPDDATGQYVLVTKEPVVNSKNGYFGWKITCKYTAAINFNTKYIAGWSTSSSRSLTKTIGGKEFTATQTNDGTTATYYTWSGSCGCRAYKAATPASGTPEQPGYTPADPGHSAVGCGSDSCSCSPTDGGLSGSTDGTVYSSYTTGSSSCCSSGCGKSRSDHTIYHFAQPGTVTYTWEDTYYVYFTGTAWADGGNGIDNKSFTGGTNITGRDISFTRTEAYADVFESNTDCILKIKDSKYTNTGSSNGLDTIYYVNDEAHLYVAKNYSDPATVTYTKGFTIGTVACFGGTTEIYAGTYLRKPGGTVEEFGPFDDQSADGVGGNFYGSAGTYVNQHWDPTSQSWVSGSGFVESDVETGSCNGDNNSTVTDGHYLCLFANPAQPSQSHHVNLMKTYSIKCNFDSITYADVEAYTVYTPYMLTVAGIDDHLFDESESGIAYDTSHGYAVDIASAVMSFDVKQRPTNSFGNWFSVKSNLGFLDNAAYANNNKSLLTGAEYYMHAWRDGWKIGTTAPPSIASPLEAHVHDYFVELDNGYNGTAAAGGYYTGSGRVLFSSIDGKAILDKAKLGNHMDTTTSNPVFAGACLTGRYQYTEYDGALSSTSAKFGGTNVSVKQTIDSTGCRRGMIPTSYFAPGLEPNVNQVNRYVAYTGQNFSAFTSPDASPMGHVEGTGAGYIAASDMTPFGDECLSGYAEGYDAHARYYESGDCHLFFECRWKNTGAPWVAPAADIAVATAEWLNANQRVTVISDYIDVRNETGNWSDIPIFGYTGVYTCSGSISAPAGLDGNVDALVVADKDHPWLVRTGRTPYITNYMDPAYTITIDFGCSPIGDSSPSNASLEHGIMELTTQDMMTSDYLSLYKHIGDGAPPGTSDYAVLSQLGYPFNGNGFSWDGNNFVAGTFWGLGQVAYNNYGSEKYYLSGFNGQWGGNGSFLYDRSVAGWNPFATEGPAIDMALNQLMSCNANTENLWWCLYFESITGVDWVDKDGLNSTIGTGGFSELYNYGPNSDNVISYTAARNTGYSYAMATGNSYADSYTTNIMNKVIPTFDTIYNNTDLDGDGDDELASSWWEPMTQLSTDGSTRWLRFMPLLRWDWNPSGTVYLSSVACFESLYYEDMDFSHTGANLNIYIPWKVTNPITPGFGNVTARRGSPSTYYSIGDYVDDLHWVSLNDDVLGGSPTNPVGLYTWIYNHRADQTEAINQTLSHQVYATIWQGQGWVNTCSPGTYRIAHYGGTSDYACTLGKYNEARLIPAVFASAGIGDVEVSGYATASMTTSGYLAEIGPFNLNDDAGNGLWSDAVAPYVSFMLVVGNNNQGAKSNLATDRNTNGPSLADCVNSSNGADMNITKDTFTVRCQYKENLGDIYGTDTPLINDIVIHNPVSTEYCYVFDADTVDNDAVDQRTVGNVNATDRQWVNIGGVCGVWWSDFGNFYDDRYTARTNSPTKYRGFGTVDPEGWNWSEGTDLNTLKARELLLVDGSKDQQHLIYNGHIKSWGVGAAFGGDWGPGLWLSRSSDGFYHNYGFTGDQFHSNGILPDHAAANWGNVNNWETEYWAMQGYMYNMDNGVTYSIPFIQTVDHDPNAKTGNFIGIAPTSGDTQWGGNYPIMRSEYPLNDSRYFATRRTPALSDDAPAIIDGEVYADPAWGNQAKNYPLGNSWRGFSGAQYYLTQLYGNTGYMNYMNCEEFVGERYIVFPFPVGWYDAEGNWNVTGKGEKVDVNKLLFNSAGEKVTEMQDYRTAVVTINGEDVRLADREPLALEHPDNNVPGATMVSDMQPGYFLEFYILTSSEEAQDARVEFISIAKNAPDNSSGAVDMELTNAMPNNGDRSDVSYAALHCAKSLFYVDVVGRIGNPAIEDFGDFRFSNLFKQPTSEWLIPGVIHKIDIERPNMMISVPHDIFMKDVTDFTAHHASLSMTAWVLDAHFDGEKLVGKSGEFKTLPLTPSDNNVQDYKYTIPRIGYDIYMDIETVGNYYGVNSASIDSGSWKDDDESKKYKMTIKPYWYLLDLDTSEFVPVDFWYGEEGSRVRCYEFGSDNRDYMNCNYQLEVDLPTEYMRRDVSGAEYNLNTGTNAAGQNVFDIWNGTLVDGVAITNPSHVNPLETGPDYIGSASQIYLDEWDRLYIGSPVMYGTLNVDGGSSHYTDIKAYLGKDYESTGVANPDIVDLRGDGSKPNPSNPDPHVSDIIWNRWLGGMLFNQLMGYSSKDPADPPASGGNGMSYVNAGIKGASYLNRLSNFAFYEQAQRWYYTIGLPSSALAVPHSSIIDQRQFTTVHEQMEADHPRHTFVCALTYEVKGEPWTLAYDWESSGLMEEDALGKYIPIRVFDLVDPTTGDPLYEYKFREGGGGSTITDRLIPVIVCGGEPGTIDGRDPVTGEDIHSDGGGGNSPEDLDIYGTH